ncbi:hypothetical protein VPH35_021151 [Triticum aestivum]
MNPKMMPRQHIGSGSSRRYRCKGKNDVSVTCKMVGRCLTVPVTSLGVSPADPKQHKTKEPLARSRQVVGLEATSAGTCHGISRGHRSGEGGACLIRRSGDIQAATMAARRRGGRVAVTGGAGKSICSRAMEVGWRREGGPKMLKFLVELQNMMKEYMARLETKN